MLFILSAKIKELYKAKSIFSKKQYLQKKLCNIIYPIIN